MKTDKTTEQRIHEHLGKLYPPEDAIAFLQTPQKLLHGEIPARLIARGEGDRVLLFIEQIISGAYL